MKEYKDMTPEEKRQEFIRLIQIAPPEVLAEVGRRMSAAIEKGGDK